MTEQLARLRDAIRRPLPLGYHPLYRFYRGGSLTRAFRGLPGGADDWWSEDWVGSCTRAGNDDPDGHPQGMSPVEVADEIDVSDGRCRGLTGKWEVIHAGSGGDLAGRLRAGPARVRAGHRPAAR